MSFWDAIRGLMLGGVLSGAVLLSVDGSGRRLSRTRGIICSAPADSSAPTVHRTVATKHSRPNQGRSRAPELPALDPPYQLGEVRNRLTCPSFGLSLGNSAKLFHNTVYLRRPRITRRAPESNTKALTPDPGSISG